MHLNGRGKFKIHKRHLILGGTGLLIGLTCFCLVLGIFTDRREADQKGNTTDPLSFWLEERLTETFMPVFTFIDADAGGWSFKEFLGETITSGIPLYRYEAKMRKQELSREDEETYDLLVRQEGADEDRKEIDEDSLEYGEDALHIDGDLEKAMLDENNKLKQPEEAPSEEESQEIPKEPVEFARASEKAYEYNWAELQSYEDLISAFYAVDNTTVITDEQINLDNLLGKDLTMKGSSENPQILVYHTHSQETFVDSVPGDPSTSIVGAGERLSSILREEYGYNVLHHTGQYDVESRDYAYSNSLPAIEKILADNPSIEVVIDLHRDAVKEGRKLAIELQGKPTAQFMLFNGLSRTRKNGDISYLENPNVNDNLAFSFQAQVLCNEYYPGIARRIYLKAYRYNMHLRPKTLLVEMGAQTNTVEEIMNACEPLAHVIHMVLSGQGTTLAEAGQE